MKFLFPILVVLFLLSGCSGGREALVSQATDIARAGGFSPVTFQTDRFDLFGYQRISEPDAKVAHIYIEGDGMAWRSRTRPSLDPTPREPLTLRLAALDGAANVVYLARPCQYVRSAACEQKYWTSHRSAPEVIQSYRQVLETLRALHGFDTLHLVGYSGGATVALLLANEAGVASIRTIAGNLSPTFHSRYHGVDPQSGSLEPLDYKSALMRVPQIHFLGGDDTIVPAAIGDHYISAFSDSSCITEHVHPGISHHSGWEVFWKQAQHIIPTCQN